MALSRTAYVNLLRDQSGYHEGRDPSGNWNNQQKFSPAVPGLEWSQGQAWCHVFVSWGADELNARDTIPITASCAAGVAWWKKRNRWTDYPVLGAPFYMGSVGQDHVGVVYRYDADSIWTIEGNTNTNGSYQGDGVYHRVRPRRGAGSPYGYGVPDFTEGTISADPALGGTGAASVPEQPVKPTPSEEDHVQPIDVWAYKGQGPAGQPEKRDAYAYLRDTEGTVRALAAKVDALTAKVASLEATGLTPEQITAIANAVADVQSRRLAN